MCIDIKIGPTRGRTADLSVISRTPSPTGPWDRFFRSIVDREISGNFGKSHILVSNDSISFTTQRYMMVIDRKNGPTRGRTADLSVISRTPSPTGPWDRLLKKFSVI